MPKKKSKRVPREQYTTQTSVDWFRNPRIVHAKLGREGNWGEQYAGTSLIKLDPRMKAKRYLNVLVHEWFHCILPDLNEKTVKLLADKLAGEIWSRRYRRIEK